VTHELYVALFLDDLQIRESDQTTLLQIYF
jgi:hypothetical protein